MDSPFAHLLDKTHLPQPSLQRFAVVSIFDKLRSGPARHGPLSASGRDALARCLTSPSAAVADQAVREILRLVSSAHLPLPPALLELHSALEGCAPRFVPLFVKAIGFLSRRAFLADPAWGCGFESPDLHPFVKVLTSRAEAQPELIRQVLLFITHCKAAGMEAVSGFLKPFLTFSVLRKHSPLVSSSFARDLVSSIGLLSCSLPSEAVCIIKLLVGCLKYFPNNSEEDFKHLISSAEYLVDAFVVVLKQMVCSEELLSAAQACGLELLETLLSLCICLEKPWGGTETVLELSKSLLVAEKALGFTYLPEFVIVTVSISHILTQVEFEHEQLSILKLLIFLIEWKTEKEYYIKGDLCEELLYVFPVINLLSSPSKSVKEAAAYLLSAVEGLLLDLSVGSRKSQNAGLSFISKQMCIPFRLLYHLWFQEKSTLPQIYFLAFTCRDVCDAKETSTEQKYWTSQLKDYLTVERHKFISPAEFRENKLPGMTMLLSSVASILTMHPILGRSAVDCLVDIGRMDPGLGMPLLLSVLFYNKILCSRQISTPDLLLGLLELLPSLASHSDMVQLILQTILPMLHKDTKPVLYAVAVRLLCKTWIVSDRAFGTLQGILDTQAISDFMYEREIYISIAASIRDVCKHNPDRGVDLILSVSSCIESRDSSIQALGLESLAHLCEADVVDFYTAWNVVAKHTTRYSVDPIVAHGVCTVLRWGAMDAEAYPEASDNVLQILWEVATSRSPCSSPLWVKARVSAFKSLAHYEVKLVQEKILDFKKRNFMCLTSEENYEILKAVEGFEVKIINFEHTTRRRVNKKKRVVIHKVEKLLQVLPQAMFSSAHQNYKASELPGAALLSLVFTPKDLQSRGTSKDFLKVHDAYKNALKELADSLNVPRNVFVALLALQSWKSFIQRWMKAGIFADKTVSTDVTNKSSKVAHDILKTLCMVAAESIPRVAVNIAFAFAALCLVAPPSADAVFSAASNFLLKWVSEYEHEHKQWSAAISLGLISNCFHATDRNQKIGVITALLKVLGNSKSNLVKGACGAGLGFASQDLLTRVDVDYSSSKGTTSRLTETVLLQNIVRTLSLSICELCPSTLLSIRRLNECFPLDRDDAYDEIASDMRHVPQENCDYLEEDPWGVAGLVLGLGNSVAAIYRSGAHDAVVKIKDMLISWIPDVDSSFNGSFVSKEMAELPLSMGSCLALPTVVAFCQRVELMDDDLDVLFNRYVSLISLLLNLKKSGILYQNMLMTSCIGAGSFLSCIMSVGVHSMTFDHVKHMLEILRCTYTHPYPPTVQLGGMLGVVNALGADAGDLTRKLPLPTHWQINSEQESSLIRGPILSNSICETLATSMVQEIFLVAKDSRDIPIQRYAAWAVSFLGYRLLSEEFQNADNSQIGSIDLQNQSFAEDSLVWTLCLWLRDNCHKSDGVHATTILTVLRCLSKAPRLPTLDWGVIMRNCMRYEANLSVKECIGQASQLLREECVCFSIAHAKNVSSLLLFLDELTDLSRFKTLELNLQSTLLQHMSDLLTFFPGSKIEKLYEDLVEYFSSSSSCLIYDFDQKSLLRVSFWKGLHECLVEVSKESVCISMMEKCMERLFSLLPPLTCNDSSGRGQTDSVEWSEAIRCLSKARQDWLMLTLQIPDSVVHGGSHSIEVAKLISARARLIRCDCIPISQLGKIKTCILNARYQGIWWSVLVEVAAAVSTAGVGIKRQWLLDALEISCIAEYPSTALRFIGLLSGGCSKYMPLLIIDPTLVLSELPVTLLSLLSDNSWSAIAESVVDKLWASTERICTWAAQLTSLNGSPNHNGIDGSEGSMSGFLAHVMHQTCVSLKEYLSFEKQFRLANMEIPQPRV